MGPAAGAGEDRDRDADRAHPWLIDMPKVLQACRMKSRHVLREIHPSRLEGVVRDVHMRISPDSAAALMLVRSHLNLVWPPVRAFCALDWRLSVLPYVDLRRVLCAIGAHGERGRARLTVSKPLRAALVDAVGECAYRAMLDERAPRHESRGSFEASELSPDRLARKGAWLVGQARRPNDAMVHRGGRGSATEPQAAWPALAPWLMAALAWEPGGDGSTLMPMCDETGGSLPVHRDPFDYLPQYFPEFQWLFGSVSETSASASKTG